MVLTTFVNPACFPLTANQIYVPPSRETTLCLTLNAEYKKQVLSSGNRNQYKPTRNQRFAYLSNIDPTKKRTYAIQGDLGSNPNTHNLPLARNGQIMTENCNTT